ncbi:MAG: hypothetical protein E3J35_04295 [Methanomassiliicoccales archaeon]|nr:MAG: hypothetical protein E3J35_04295 [Methanomassiliicoccales archaeon]
MNLSRLARQSCPQLVQVRMDPPDFGLRPLARIAHRVVFDRHHRSVPEPSVSIEDQTPAARIKWDSSVPSLRFSSSALSEVNSKTFGRYATFFWFVVAVHECFHMYCDARKRKMIYPNSPWRLTDSTQELWVKKRTSHLTTEMGEVWCAFQTVGHMISQNIPVDLLNYATLCSVPQCESYAGAFCPICQSYYCSSHFSHRHPKYKRSDCHNPSVPRHLNTRMNSESRNILQSVWVVYLMKDCEMQPIAISASDIGASLSSSLDYLSPNDRVLIRKTEPPVPVDG